MTLTISDSIRDAVRRSAGKPIQVVHEAASEEFLVVPKDATGTFRAGSILDGFTDAEQDFLLREAGRRAGWDAPSMDIDNDLDRRKKP